jgi:hypothetical protein
MRRMIDISVSRSECLRQAKDYDWLEQNAPTAEGAAFFFDRARLWRSLALVARTGDQAGLGRVDSTDLPHSSQKENGETD